MMIMIKLIINNEHLLYAHYLAALTDLIFTMNLSPTLA